MQGPNSRVCFPFRRIEKIRDAPRENVSLDRMVTLVNRVFPFSSVIRLAQHYTVSLAEPESPTRTRYYNYQLTLPKQDGAAPTEEEFARAKRDAAFVTDTGAEEDAKVVSAIQAAIGSGANSHYRFGRFESAIAHLHKHLASNLTRLDQAERDIVKIVSQENT
jgi:choline monooxygenase